VLRGWVYPSFSSCSPADRLVATANHGGGLAQRPLPDSHATLWCHAAPRSAGSRWHGGAEMRTCTDSQELHALDPTRVKREACPNLACRLRQPRIPEFASPFARYSSRQRVPPSSFAFGVDARLLSGQAEAPADFSIAETAPGGRPAESHSLSRGHASDHWRAPAVA
jgi:hypothetical protein